MICQQPMTYKLFLITNVIEEIEFYSILSIEVIFIANSCSN